MNTAYSIVHVTGKVTHLSDVTDYYSAVDQAKQKATTPGQWHLIRNEDKTVVLTFMINS